MSWVEEEVGAPLAGEMLIQGSILEWQWNGMGEMTLRIHELEKAELE